MEDTDILEDLLCSIGSGSNEVVEKLKIHYCCDLVYNRDGRKYILGTNQLFPVYEENVLNGGAFDVQLYLYSALKWKDMLYTDAGNAVYQDEDPDATLGYNCGIDILSYKGSTPCLARSTKQRTLTVDQWSRLTNDAVLTSSVIPTLWVKADWGHKFWTPDEGFISAIPLDLPIVLDSAASFSRAVRYRSGYETLLVRLQILMYEFMKSRNISRIYMGHPAELTKQTETHLVDAYEWSETHSRRLGVVDYNHKYFLSAVGANRMRKLAIALNNASFTQEEIFA